MTSAHIVTDLSTCVKVTDTSRCGEDGDLLFGLTSSQGTALTYWAISPGKKKHGVTMTKGRWAKV